MRENRTLIVNFVVNSFYGVLCGVTSLIVKPTHACFYVVQYGLLAGVIETGVRNWQKPARNWGQITVIANIREICDLTPVSLFI